MIIDHQQFDNIHGIKIFQTSMNDEISSSRNSSNKNTVPQET